jgi:hypothetical protein
VNSLFAALGLAGALLVVGGALSLFDESTTAAPPAPMGMAMGGRGMSMGGGAHDWHGGTGTIPSALDGLTKLERRQTIVIGNDSQFNPANGVRSGHGTFDDPYVISGWDVDTVAIANTHKAFELKEDRINTILVLDWTGQGGYVHHDYIANLRTNRNVARTGDATAAVIENNQIDQVQELRHFDGEVRNNTIGTPPLVAGVPSLLGNDVVFNIAGGNCAGIHDNLIYGGVDMKLHGHHHSDTPCGRSHNHGKPDNATAAAAHDDHQVRYDVLEFYANHIIDDKFGFRYNDLNHAGDDRTATSEDEPDLDLPHIHYETLLIHDNVIEGSALNVVVVNAPDDHHLPGEHATVEIANNTIVKPTSGNGILLQDVRDASVTIRDNQVQKSLTDAGSAAAIFLTRFHNATVTVVHNAFGADAYGVRASQFDAATRWTVADNDAAGVAHPIYWDSSVANAPETGEDGAAGSGAAGGGHDASSGLLADAARLAQP